MVFVPKVLFDQIVDLEDVDVVPEAQNLKHDFVQNAVQENQLEPRKMLVIQFQVVGPQDQIEVDLHAHVFQIRKQNFAKLGVQKHDLGTQELLERKQLDALDGNFEVDFVDDFRIIVEDRNDQVFDEHRLDFDVVDVLDQEVEGKEGAALDVELGRHAHRVQAVDDVHFEDQLVENRQKLASVDGVEDVANHFLWITSSKELPRVRFSGYARARCPRKCSF